jgi:hypothetical protein
MTEVDITHRIRGEFNQIGKIRRWLNDNVGSLGRGEFPLEGQGWDIVIKYGRRYNDTNESKWVVRINDEQRAVLFALRWA